MLPPPRPTFFVLGMSLAAYICMYCELTPPWQQMISPFSTHSLFSNWTHLWT